MALWKGKSEHAGHKGSTRKDGFWGKRAEAKRSAKKQRRSEDAEYERTSAEIEEGLAELERAADDGWRLVWVREDEDE